MKKLQLLIIPAVLLLCGCTTYSFHKGASPYDKGYVVDRYGRTLPEYTVGKDNSVPDEPLAKERFNRRKAAVEGYYKQMGYIENRFKQMFIDPPVFMVKSIVGLLGMPSIALADYKYNHDPKYKEEVDKKEDAEYRLEKERLKGIKDKLNKYIAEDLSKESPVLEQALDAQEEKAKSAPEIKELVVEQSLDQEQKAIAAPKTETEPTPVLAPEVTAEPKPVQEPQTATPEPKAIEEPVPPLPQAEEKRLSSPVARIIARPVKGPSPLIVKFSGAKSSSVNGRIIAYSWDFGDGDTSTKQNPANTYWSATYGSRIFTASLTVKDIKGATATTSMAIEVLAQ